MRRTLSKQLARFAADLSFEDIPPEVIDKSKACTLLNLTAALIGANTPKGRAITRLVKQEDTIVERGATILGEGSKVSRTGAVFCNSDLMCVTNQCDSYCMLTHPGSTVIPAALATSEIEKRSGKEFLTALVTGYEVHNRIARDFIPSTQARGFRAASVYGIFGAAVATGKLLGFNEDKMACTISLSVASASGNLETARTGEWEDRMHVPNAARTGTLAALVAGETLHYPETALEGQAGFYYAFTGNSRGRLSYTYTGPRQVKLSTVVENLGKHYEMLNVTFKSYPTPGFNNPVIELTKNLKHKYQFAHDRIKEILIEVNWLEITYPSPVFPRKYLTEPNIGTIHYVAAYVCVEGNYPTYGQWWDGSAQQVLGESRQLPEVLTLMKRVRVVGSKERNFFSPRMTITMKDGSSYTGELTGDEFKWDFEEGARRVIAWAPGLPIPLQQFDRLIDIIRHLEKISSISELVELCCYSAGQ